jgi:hypothetical protein
MYGHNRLYGGPGDDTVVGYYARGKGERYRTLNGGSGNDRIRSYSGANDTIYAVDGERDRISCGQGTDTVYFDRGVDSVNPLNCENRRPR